MSIEDCQLVQDISDFKGGVLPSEYTAFVLKSKEKKLGVLLYKGLRPGTGRNLRYWPISLPWPCGV